MPPGSPIPTRTPPSTPRRIASPARWPTGRPRPRRVELLAAEGAAGDRIGEALAALDGRAPFADAVVRLRSAAAELADVVSDLRSVGETIEEDPERLAAVRERRQLIVDLRRKYGTATLDGSDAAGGTLVDVLAYRDAAAARLAAIEGHDDQVQRLEADRDRARKAEARAAAAVAAARRKAAPALASDVQAHLRELAMPKARLEVSVEGPDPADDVRFLLAANPGAPPQPLAKVASGGELARAMLALRLVLRAAPPVLVFDEVDAGVGGAAAIEVGRALAALGGDHQVLVVTHLPQVAAFADTQVTVTKRRSRWCHRVPGGHAGAGGTHRGAVTHAVGNARQRAGPSGRQRAAGHRGAGPGPMMLRGRASDDGTPAAVTGIARPDRRTKHLVQRIAPGEIAIIDHKDLDRVAAETLVEAKVAAVVNAAPSVSGRYPNVGPLVVVAAGIPLVDAVGSDVLLAVEDGTLVSVVDDEVRVGEHVVGVGERQTMESLERKIAAARSQIGDELERFAQNTLNYIQQEAHLLVDEPDVPDIPVRFRGRHVLVVVRGIGYKDDLEALRRSGYLQEMKPLLVGVDGGADALREIGYQPDVIIGDMDSVSEETLRSGAALVVHGYADRAAPIPGAARLDDLGLEYATFRVGGHVGGHRDAAWPSSRVPS